MRRRMRFSLVLIGALLVLVFSGIVIRACWFPASQTEPVFLGGDVISFFEFGLPNDPLFRGYEYRQVANSVYYYGMPDPAEHLSGDNLKDWLKYVGHGLAAADLNPIVYKTPVAQLEMLRKKMRDGTATAAYQKTALAANKFIKYIVDNGQTELLDYLIYALNCEPHVLGNPDPWGPKPVRDRAKMQRLVEDGLNLYKGTQVAYLQLRYAYQIVRLANYAGLYADCLRYYDELVPPLKVNSVISYWTMRQKAGALIRLGRKAEGLVLTSLIFDQCPSLMSDAYLDSRNLDDQIWDAALSQADNNHRQATLWMLRGLHEDRIDLEPLRRMCALEPASSRLEVMLIRQINKLEREVLRTERFFSNGRAQAKQNQDVLDLMGFARRTAEDGRVRRPGLWFLAAGYMNFLAGDDAAAKTLLGQARDAAAQDKNLGPQIGLIGNLVALAATGEITPAMETALMPSLQWTGGLTKDYDNPAIRRSLLVLLAQKYLTAGAMHKAITCLACAGYEMSSALLIDIVAEDAGLINLADLLNAKAKHSSYEAALAKGVKYSGNDLNYIRATRLMRQGKFSQALQLFKQITPSYWTRPDKDEEEDWTIRTVFDIQPGVHVPVKDPALRAYTKLAFAQKADNLLAQAKKDPEGADRCYYQLANGFYYSTYWGYNDILWKGWMVTPLNTMEPGAYPFDFAGYASVIEAKLKEFADAYGRRETAINYYRLAAKTTRDPELAAKCIYLATLAARKPPATLGMMSPIDYQQDLKLLKGTYAGTDFYRGIIKECPGLAGK